MPLPMPAGTSVRQGLTCFSIASALSSPSTAAAFSFLFIGSVMSFISVVGGAVSYAAVVGSVCRLHQRDAVATWCHLGATGGHSIPIYTHPLPKTGRIACDRNENFPKKEKRGVTDLGGKKRIPRRDVDVL